MHAFFFIFKRNRTRRTTTDTDNTYWIILLAILSILVLACWCALIYYRKKCKFEFSHLIYCLFFINPKGIFCLTARSLKQVNCTNAFLSTRCMIYLCTNFFNHFIILDVVVYFHHLSIYFYHLCFRIKQRK